MILQRTECDDRLLPILQSLPRLRSVTIEDARDGNLIAFEKVLREALPNCKCSVGDFGK